MIRVFFNIRLDETYLHERTGQWVGDETEARDVARLIVRRLVAAHGGEQRLLNAALAVTLEGGTPLFDLSFFEALYVPVNPPEALPLHRADVIRPSPWLSRLCAALALPRAELPARFARLVDITLRRKPAPRGRFRLGFEPNA